MAEVLTTTRLPEHQPLPNCQPHLLKIEIEKARMGAEKAAAATARAEQDIETAISQAVCHDEIYSKASLGC